MFSTNHLIIIGGPSAVGKTTLLGKIQRCEVPTLFQQLSKYSPSSYLFCDAGELNTIDQISINRLVLHYDIIHQYSNEQGYTHLPALISGANHVTVLTLCTSSNLFLDRINIRLNKAQLSSLTPSFNNMTNLTGS